MVKWNTAGRRQPVAATTLPSDRNKPHLTKWQNGSHAMRNNAALDDSGHNADIQKFPHLKWRRLEWLPL